MNLSGDRSLRLIHHSLPRPVSGKLVSNTTGARSTLRGPLNSSKSDLAFVIEFNAVMIQPMLHSFQVLILAKSIKMEVQTKTIRQRNFFLNRVTWMYFPMTIVSALKVVAHPLANQMSSI